MCFVVPSSIILRALPDVKDDNGRARHSRSLVGFQRIASAMLRDGGVRNLLEVKSSTKAKPEHVTDAMAIGLNVWRTRGPGTHG